MLYELRTINAGPASPAKWGLLYTYNMIRGVGAVVFMVGDIENGGKISSLGVMLVMMALLGSSLYLPADWTGLHQVFKLIGHAVCFAGAGLYTASGILSIIHRGFLGRSVTVVVTMGCPDGLHFQNDTLDDFPIYCPALQPNYEFQDSKDMTIFPRIM
jgi:hypothetical protein